MIIVAKAVAFLLYALAFVIGVPTFLFCWVLLCEWLEGRKDDND